MTRLMFLSALAAAALLTSCSRSDLSPSQTAEKFYDEVAAGNIDAAKTLSTPDTVELIERLVAAQGPGALKAEAGRKATGETIDGDSANVTFDSKDGSVANVPLTKIDGQWKVDLTKAVREAVKRAMPPRDAPASE